MNLITTLWRVNFIRMLALCILCASIFLTACVRVSWQYDRSPSTQPHLSVDTIRLDTLYSTRSSTTHRVMLYNPHRDALLLDEISLLSRGTKGYRINVDGHSGVKVQGIALPPGDSIYIFIEGTFTVGDSDLLTLITDSLLWVCNGETHYTRVEGYRQNVTILPSGLHITRDTLWSAERPYLVADSVTVDPGARLTIVEGGHLLMPLGGRIIVRGALSLLGSASRGILIEGIRRDYLTPGVSYRRLPNQWDCICFTAESQGNELRYTTVCNGQKGLIFETTTSSTAERLTLLSSSITNMGETALALTGGRYRLRTCELSNAGGSCLTLEYASVEAEHLTITSEYLFDHRLSPALYVGKGSRLRMVNSIVDGRQTVAQESDTLRRSGEVAWHPSLTAEQIRLEQCYLRLEQDSVAADKLLRSLFPSCHRARGHFVDTYWMLGKDYQDRHRKEKKYHFHFDYHPVVTAGLQELSPLAPEGCALDRMGVPRVTNEQGGYTLGAYEALPVNTTSGLIRPRGKTE